MRQTLPAFVLLFAALPAAAQSGAKAEEWRTYGGDLGNTHYSPIRSTPVISINLRSPGGSKPTT